VVVKNAAGETVTLRGEINKRVAGAIFAKRLFSAPVRKGLRFFFGLRGRACE
jgi:hypothetical protein